MKVLTRQLILHNSQGVECTNPTVAEAKAGIEYKCAACPTGYAGDGRRSSCADINECVAGLGGVSPVCDPLTTCTNTVGGFNCTSCPAGANWCCCAPSFYDPVRICVDPRLSVTSSSDRTPVPTRTGKYSQATEAPLSSSAARSPAAAAPSPPAP